jgi:hypothetical protein
MIVARLTQCPVCGSAASSGVLDLPAFPLTGIYAGDPAASYPKPDQSLKLCDDCGHGYLANIVDPTLLYEKTYTHRTGGSPIARASNDVFWDFVQKLAGRRRFASALEIGCNDLYLMEKLGALAEHAAGIDPIWRDRAPPPAKPNVRIIGKFVSEVNLAAGLAAPPDLILSSHTFEHMADPRAGLRSAVDAAAADALFAITVPGFDALLSNYRFDQVFHQHVQYFSLASMLRMTESLGCHYLAHAFDYRCWGGALMFAFTKTPNASAPPPFRKPASAATRARVSAFKERYRVYGQEIENYDGALYGFGAAQMVPTLAYHLGRSFGRFKAIMDDNPDRIGRYFPELPVPIIVPSAAEAIGDAGVVITALDSSRPIMQRLLQLNPRTIFYPLGNM